MICFLGAKGVRAAEIHWEISEVYGENIMSNGLLQKRGRVFKHGRTNVHGVEQSGQVSHYCKFGAEN